MNMPYQQIRLKFNNVPKRCLEIASMYDILLYIYLSACLLQKQSVDYARVREYSLRVLQWRPGDVKALYRAGVATLEMGDAQTAKQYLTKACSEQPNGKKIAATSGSSTAGFAIVHMNSHLFRGI